MIVGQELSHIGNSIDIDLERPIHRALGDLRNSLYPADREGVRVPAAVFLHLLGLECAGLAPELYAPPWLGPAPLSLFHSLAGASIWCAPLPGIMRRKYFAAVLSSEVLISSLMEMMAICCLGRSAWILTPSSEFRLNMSSQATTMMSLGRTKGISSFQGGWDIELPVSPSVKMCSARIP